MWGEAGTMMGHSSGWMLFGVLHMVAFWGLVIGALALLVRAFSGKATGAARHQALELLKERYARGELDRDEFLQRKRDLEERG